jgi:hypothetical protein
MKPTTSKSDAVCSFLLSSSFTVRNNNIKLLTCPTDCNRGSHTAMEELIIQEILYRAKI